MINKIESTQNLVIKEAIRLHTKKERKRKKQFIVEGTRAVLTFLENGYKPVHLFATEDITGFENQNITLVSKSVMEKLSTAESPSGIFAVFSYPENPLPKDLSSGIVLANITDPGNMGTLIRSAAAFGHTSVVIIDGCDPFSPKVIQATAGTLPLVNLFIWSWQELQHYKFKLKLIGLVVKGGKTPQELNFNDVLFVIGNEAHGIPEEWVKECNELLTLPMPGKTESLNAGVAGSIALSLPTLFS